MKRMLNILRLLAIPLSLLTSVGCLQKTGDLVRFPIDGTVTFGGQPVRYGTIMLKPDPEKGNKGPASSAIIENAKFSIPTSRGVVGGSYIAQITGYDDSAMTPDNHLSEQAKPLFSNHEISVELPDGKSTQVFNIPSLKR
ncbi:MAG TPA: hypothetical protein VNQ76_08375 [Planctomicrobium sp.]|nr:hypothetical protein [Planctomicrobium sp.]